VRWGKSPEMAKLLKRYSCFPVGNFSKGNARSFYEFPAYTTISSIKKLGGGILGNADVL